MRIQRTGARLSVLPSTVNGTELGAQEWRDFLFLRYGIKPTDLPSHCDGCGAAFSICNALDCKKGGVVMVCHNYLCDGVANFVGKAFTPAHVRDNHEIFTGCALRGGEAKVK